MPGYGLEDAIRRMLTLSSERAFARLTDDGGFWDRQVDQVGLGQLLGTRGDVLSRILTSGPMKTRLQGVFADLAIDGAERAAPIVTDAVRTIGYRNAIDLVRGGPTGATSFLRGALGQSLLEAMVPELAQGLRLVDDPLLGQALNALTGVDIGGVTRTFAGRVEDTIWGEIGREESAIRANPRATNDPLIIGVFGIAQ